MTAETSTTADTQLETLEARGLVQLAALSPELEYLFRHALVQDAAYGSLLKQERRELHGRVGEALENLYPERVGELAPLLAMHFEQAGETEKAIDYYVAGGEHAAGQNAIREAFRAYDQATTLMDRATVAAAPRTDESDRRRRRQVEAQLGRAQAGYSFLSVEDTAGALEDAVVAAEELGDSDLTARVHLFIALGLLQAGESPTAPLVKRSLDRIAEIGEAIGDPSLLALPMALVGLSQVFGGPIREGVAALERAVPLLQQRRDSIGAAFARGALAMGYANLGEFDKAEAAAKNAREIAKDGDLIAQLDALIAESMVRSAMGQLDRAVPIAQECVDRAEETGASACVLASSWILGDAFHRQGRFSEARDVLKRGSDIALVVDRRVWRPTLQAWLGSSLSALGEDPSHDDMEEALATARSIGNQVTEAGILYKRAEVRAGRGDLEPALGDFAASAAVLENLGARPNLARLLRGWGAALRDAGRTDEAAPILQRSLSLFEELGLHAEAAAVTTMLALGATKLAFD
jgi:tetratricopeptide (TPR) repeat protein